MTLEEAKKIIKKKNPMLYIRSHVEFKDFYLFVLAPIYIGPDDDYETGTIFPVVYKKTGKISTYDITSDPEAYLKAVGAN